MSYENKDYVIPIHTSDDKVLFFSKNILINNCKAVREIEGELSELMIPFPADVIKDFLHFLESHDDKNILHVAQIADYLDLDFSSCFFIAKENIIDIFIDNACIDSKYHRHFFYFYKYLRINNIEIPDDLNQLFAETKPIYHDFDLIIDWDDIAQTLIAPQKLVDYYHIIYEKINLLKEKIIELDRTDPEYDKMKNEISKLALSITREEHHELLLSIHLLY